MRTEEEIREKIRVLYRLVGLPPEMSGPERFKTQQVMIISALQWALGDDTHMARQFASTTDWINARMLRTRESN